MAFETIHHYFYRITIHPKKITLLEIFMKPYISLVCIRKKNPSRNIFQIYIVKQISYLFTPLLLF